MRQLSIYDVARLAVAYWLRDDAITMVAIAGAESGYIEDRPSSTDVWGMPGDNASWRPYSCLSVYSWGLWQVFMPVHHYLLEEATGSTNACDWADYLCDGAHNAYIAYRIWRVQGFAAWSTYNVGAHQRFLVDATMAVDYVLAPPRPAPPPPPPPPPPPAGAPPLISVQPPSASVQPPAAHEPP
jgi:hypothetical protein